MPGTTLPPAPRHVPAPETKEDLKWAEAPLIDISKANTPEGRAELAPVVSEAMRTHGFVYVVNHGLTQAENERVFDISEVPFTQVPEDEKKLHAGKIAEVGSYRGYKLRQTWAVENGIRDQSEHYNMHHPVFYQQHPKALLPFLPEYRMFTEHNHLKIFHPFLKLLARGLELPEDTFDSFHAFNGQAESYVCLMKYFPRSDDEKAKTQNVWMRGHTDLGTCSILWSQPVAALQIKSPIDGKWRFTKYIPDAAVVIAGDSMEMFSGGYYKATIHRVFRPPPDQQRYTRLTLVYFVHPDNNVKLVPFCESPVLKRVGIIRKCADEDAPLAVEWRMARTKIYGMSKDSPPRKGDVEEEILRGLVVKHYN